MTPIPPLSEAILLGSGAVREDRYIILEDEQTCPHGCVIGTARYAIGETKSMWQGGGYWEERMLGWFWPWTLAPSYHPHPTELGHVCRTLAHEISYRHCSGESRASIAAYIATIEPKATKEVSHATTESACSAEIGRF